jgi:Ca2+-transporting ATPase
VARCPSGDYRTEGPAAVWAAPVEQTAAALRTSPTTGLTSAEASRRLAVEGANELRGDPGPQVWRLLLDQLKGMVIWLLIAASLLSFALGEAADAIAIAAIVVLNAAVGFYQEYRSGKAIAALRRMAAPQVRVVRDGRAAIVPAMELVRGDLLIVEAGDLVGADARIVESASLQVNEAPLTGESVPIEKSAGCLADPETPLADRANMLYLGTSVAAGQGRALVVATGMGTEIGRIASLLEEARPEQTPLQQRLEQVGRLLVLASLGIVGLVFLLGVLRGEPPAAMLLTAISLAVAAVPEGLPAVVTVALTLGVARMARRNALVRRLPAVETLGSAQVICTDKTGTLTVGEMTVRALWLGGREVQVGGEGYDPRGELRDAATGRSAADETIVRLALTLAAGCSETEITSSGGRPAIVGDPTEGALVVAAAKAGVARETIEQKLPRLRVFPFDSERKRMTVVRSTPQGPRAFVKGAPDLLLARCTHWLSGNGELSPLRDGERQEIERANAALAARALRVIAVAYRDLDERGALELPEDQVERELVFTGLLAMHDPPRPEAPDAVRRAQEAGIRVVMITGDHPATAAAIGRELGILREGGEVVTGTEVQSLPDAALAERAEHAAVYARVTAEDKLRIVRALKARGLVVAMTGDGVNDAPAIREAAIGIAMGRTGTEVTKQAADMVITDDNFASIVAAVEEGRGIYANIRKCLQYLLAGNTAEIMVMLAAALLGWPVPLLPLQLLWINLATDGLPALALATDPVDPSVLRRPPRPTGESLADMRFVRILLFTGVLDAAVSLGAFYYGLAVEQSLASARNYAFSALVFAELFRSLGARSPDRPFWRSESAGNPRLVATVGISVAAQLLIHHVPVLERLFGIAPVTPAASVALMALGLIPLAVLELRKEWRCRVELSLAASGGG